MRLKRTTHTCRIALLACLFGVAAGFCTSELGVEKAASFPSSSIDRISPRPLGAGRGPIRSRRDGAILQRATANAAADKGSERGQQHNLVVPAAASKKTYEHDGWTLAYRHQPAAPGHESDRPLVLVHPVGIGLSSWFWERFMETWRGGAVYAPDLIGCGDSDAWDPDERGLSVPLGWVKGVEALIRDEVLLVGPDDLAAAAETPSSRTSASRSCVVVAQGGCAPIAVLLASRNPVSVVSKVVLTSPPTWDDMTTAVPESELDRNYKFFRSDPWGKLAFNALESPWAVRLFSNLFLFGGECDDRWVDLATGAASVEARPPVAVFNSGLLNHRSYEEELRGMEQPTLVISGTDDSYREEKRRRYASEMKICSLKSVDGLNVIPWENPSDVCDEIQAFLHNSEPDYSC